MSGKTLVTGATGFLGSELVRQLVARGEEVRVLRRETSRLDLLKDEAEHAIGDITDPESVRAAMRGVGRVYHTAAHIGFGVKQDRNSLQNINVNGTTHVLNAALAEGVERLVFTSSMAAFGRTEQTAQVIDETAEWHASRMNSAYARSKHEGELEVYRAIAEGLDAVIVNPALIFGPGRHGDNTMQIVEKVRLQKLPGVPSGGTNVVDVADVAAGHILAMDKGRTGERYFLGSENLSWQEIIATLAGAFQVRAPRRVVSPRMAMVLALISEAAARLTRTRPLLNLETARVSSRFYRYSNRKAVEELGCTFRPFSETARRIAAA